MSYTVNRPIMFTGTEEERERNYASHHFVSYDHEEPERCMDCDAATYHVAADYPCGVEPPRETVTVGGDIPKAPGLAGFYLARYAGGTA